MSERGKKVLVFAERMLPSTQTFIPLQVDALERYHARYIGLIPAERNYPLEQEPILLTKERSAMGRTRRELYRWTGTAPRFHARAAQEGAAVLHAHFAEAAAPALALADALDLPLVLHLRGGAEMLSDAELRKEPFQWPYLKSRRRLWRRAARFLCVSEFIRERAIAAGFPEDKTQLLYTGMDLGRFTVPVPAKPVPGKLEGSRGKDSNLVLYVGRLVPYKGCDFMLRAMKLVQQKRPGARAVVIGDGTFRPELERLARELGINCMFPGEQPHSAIHAWLERARVFCGPSVEQEDGMSEAFGNVFSEAQAMGVPVVSFRHGGIPETMLDGVTGLLAPERDVETLAAHLLRYLGDDEFWASSSDAGREWVRSRFDVKRQTAELEEIYDAVIEEYRSR